MAFKSAVSSRTRSAGRTLASIRRDDLERPDRIALVAFIVFVMIVMSVPVIRSYVIDDIITPVYVMIVFGWQIIFNVIF